MNVISKSVNPTSKIQKLQNWDLLFKKLGGVKEHPVNSSSVKTKSKENISKNPMTAKKNVQSVGKCKENVSKNCITAVVRTLNNRRNIMFIICVIKKKNYHLLQQI